MNWDDLRYFLALAKHGTLARAARELKVDHTTVGRRIEALEKDLGVRLFARTPTGYVVTAEGEALLPEIGQVEEAMLSIQRGALAADEGLEGTVRITTAETFGACYLAPRLVAFRQKHPSLAIELMMGGAVFDLGRREADVAVRFFRSKHEHLVVRRAGEVAYSLYGSAEYFERHALPKEPEELRDHALLGGDLTPYAVDVEWLNRLTGSARFSFTSNLTVAVLRVALAGGGIALLPRYLGDLEPTLRRVPMPEEPTMPLWLTVHRDLRNTRRVRAVLDFLHATLEHDRPLLLGAR